MVLFILTITVLLVGFIALWKRRRNQALLESFYEAILKEPMNSPESIQRAAQLWWNLGYTLNGMGKRDKAWLCVERLQSLDSEMAELLRWTVEHPNPSRELEVLERKELWGWRESADRTYP
jgi:hypothetical protein